MSIYLENGWKIKQILFISLLLFVFPLNTENNKKKRIFSCLYIKKSQDAFNKYVDASCKENKFGLHLIYCEMMLKKDRLRWLDKTLLGI